MVILSSWLIAFDGCLFERVTDVGHYYNVIQVEANLKIYPGISTDWIGVFITLGASKIPKFPWICGQFSPKKIYNDQYPIGCIYGHLHPFSQVSYQPFCIFQVPIIFSKLHRFRYGILAHRKISEHFLFPLCIGVKRPVPFFLKEVTQTKRCRQIFALDRISAIAFKHPRTFHWLAPPNEPHHVSLSAVITYPFSALILTTTLPRNFQIRLWSHATQRIILWYA